MKTDLSAVQRERIAELTIERDNLRAFLARLMGYAQEISMDAEILAAASADAQENDECSFLRARIDRQQKLIEWQAQKIGIIERERDSLRALASKKSCTIEYARANPLGGPARVFDAAAERIRSGEALDTVMRDYGLAWAVVS